MFSRVSLGIPIIILWLKSRDQTSVFQGEPGHPSSLPLHLHLPCLSASLRSTTRGNIWNRITISYLVTRNLSNHIWDRLGWAFSSLPLECLCTCYASDGGTSLCGFSKLCVRCFLQDVYFIFSTWHHLSLFFKTFPPDNLGYGSQKLFMGLKEDQED